MPLPHESLVAWQRADDLFIRIHKLSKTYIVEGFARYLPRERAQFLRPALASLAELTYCVHAARRLDYINADVKKEIDLELRSVDAPLRGLLRAKGPTT